MKAKIIGHNLRPVSAGWKPFTHLVFKVVYNRNREHKIIEYINHKSIITKQTYLEQVGKFESYPNGGKK